jgi:hypothetical protein
LLTESELVTSFAHHVEQAAFAELAQNERHEQAKVAGRWTHETLSATLSAKGLLKLLLIEYVWAIRSHGASSQTEAAFWQTELAVAKEREGGSGSLLCLPT